MRRCTRKRAEVYSTAPKRHRETENVAYRYRWNANCGKHTYPSPKVYCAIFALSPSRECPEYQSASARTQSAFARGHAYIYACLSSHVHLNFLRYVYVFPRRFLFSPISSPCASRTENNARDPTPINWFLRDICNFLAARLSPRSFIAHFICAKPPLSRRSAEARNHGWSYVTFTSELAKLIQLFFKAYEQYREHVIQSV